MPVIWVASLCFLLWLFYHWRSHYQFFFQLKGVDLNVFPASLWKYDGRFGPCPLDGILWSFNPVCAFVLICLSGLLHANPQGSSPRLLRLATVCCAGVHTIIGSTLTCRRQVWSIESMVVMEMSPWQPGSDAAAILECMLASGYALLPCRTLARHARGHCVCLRQYSGYAVLDLKMKNTS